MINKKVPLYFIISILMVFFFISCEDDTQKKETNNNIQENSNVENNNITNNLVNSENFKNNETNINPNAENLTDNTEQNNQENNKNNLNITNAENVTTNAENVTANAENVTANAENVTANAENVTTNAENVTTNTENNPNNSSNNNSVFTRPTWFIHISDTHIGLDEEASISLRKVFENIEPVIQPAAIINSGDLVDAGREEEQWIAYREIMDDYNVQYNSFIDVIGNHDVKDEGNFFLNYSVSGTAVAEFYGQTFFETPQGSIRVVHTTTVEGNTVPANLVGFVTEEQVNNLIAEDIGDRNILATIVTGHHPIQAIQGLSILGTDEHMKRLLTELDAWLYLCGHVHSSELSWIDNTLVAQADSIGKTSNEKRKFFIVAVDSQGPSIKEVTLNLNEEPLVDWPLVMITSPANPALARNNPRAVQISEAEENVKVNALVFTNSNISKVEYKFDDEDPMYMINIEGNFWQGNLLTEGFYGERKLQVKVETESGEASDSISVYITP